MTIDAIESCSAVSPPGDTREPWDPTLDMVDVGCKVQHSQPGCCGYDGC